MIEPVLEDVKQYVFDNAHIEACGLLSLERGRVKWNPCKNKAENPKHDQWFQVITIYFDTEMPSVLIHVWDF